MATDTVSIRRNKRATVYLTDGQYARWCQAAAAVDLPISDFMRRAVDAAADNELGRRNPA